MAQQPNAGTDAGTASGAEPPATEVMLPVREMLQRTQHGERIYVLLDRPCVLPHAIKATKPDEYAWVCLGFQLGTLLEERRRAESEGNLALALLKRRQMQEVQAAVCWFQRQSKRRSWSLVEVSESEEGPVSGSRVGRRRKRQRKQKGGHGRNERGRH